MPDPTISEMPPAPTVNDSPSNFTAKTFAFYGAMAAFITQVNAVVAWIALKIVAIAADAASALAAKAAAEAAAASASSAANVTKWVSGTVYPEGTNVWSPINGVTYRRRTTGGGAIDPSIDLANWALPNAANLPVQRISANTVAQWGIHYVFEAACTLTLPVAGANKDAVIRISNASGLSSGCLMDFGAGKLRGASPGLMNISDRYFSETLQDTGSPTIGYTA